ncbi:hypothetical protein HYFRA_00007171 [Hymenoscyphus fraxineus]|uniref:BPL/LPL catalytic domain-containing protein n=1 Tax=Hymenoscyphus fraxineus TaxID=746836 RepID=A0A9N9KZV7_9HELO|nr:hypothetical protein HYFRA_00007171 [Hymenoscyphus fraxineus]
MASRSLVLTPPPLLQHIHIRGLTPFSKILALQSKLVAKNLLHKASPSTHPPLLPTIISFTPPPIYTFGRRSPPSLLEPEQIERLKEKLLDDNAGLRLGTNVGKPYEEIKHNRVEIEAEVEATLRGGLTTFHGPGQIVIFPIVDLKADSIVNRLGGNYRGTGLDARSFVELLENTTIRLLNDEYGIKAKRTENPGVWVDTANWEDQLTPTGRIEAFMRHLRRQSQGQNGYEAVDEKIAALGVQHRRYISSFGLAINHSTDMRWFDRITACGLLGKGTTSMRELGGRAKLGITRSDPRVREDQQMQVAQMWARMFAGGIWGIRGPFGKTAHPIWKECVMSRVWGWDMGGSGGWDMGGSGEGKGLEEVDEAMLDSAGQWPLPEDPSPKLVPWTMSMERSEQRKLLRRRNDQWRTHNVLKWLDTQISEIWEQVKGKKFIGKGKTLGDIHTQLVRETSLQLKAQSILMKQENIIRDQKRRNERKPVKQPMEGMAEHTARKPREDNIRDQEETREQRPVDMVEPEPIAITDQKSARRRLLARVEEMERMGEYINSDLRKRVIRYQKRISLKERERYPKLRKRQANERNMLLLRDQRNARRSQRKARGY